MTTTIRAVGKNHMEAKIKAELYCHKTVSRGKKIAVNCWDFEVV